MKLLINDITAFASVLGVSNPDLVWTLATIPWESESDRNMFIAQIATMDGPVTA